MASDEQTIHLGKDEVQVLDWQNSNQPVCLIVNTAKNTVSQLDDKTYRLKQTRYQQDLQVKKHNKASRIKLEADIKGFQEQLKTALDTPSVRQQLQYAIRVYNENNNGNGYGVLYIPQLSEPLFLQKNNKPLPQD